MTINKLINNMKICCVIVAYKNKQSLFKCVSCVFEQSLAVSDIVIVNNHGTLEDNFNSRIPITIINNSNNLFYGVSLNIAINKVRADFYICLNDDAYIDNNFVKEAIKGFDIGEDIGMVCGKVLSSDGMRIDSAGLFLGLARQPVDRGHQKATAASFNNQNYVFGVPGAVAFYRKTMLDSVRIGSDYFDSEYKMFYEDIDLCWRANRLGWRAYYVPSALAYHQRGLSARTNDGVGRRFGRRFLNKELHFELIKNRYLTIIKNETIAGFLSHMLFIIVYEAVIWLYIIIFNPLIAMNFIRLFSLKKAFRKRKLINNLVLKKS